VHRALASQARITQFLHVIANRRALEITTALTWIFGSLSGDPTTVRLPERQLYSTQHTPVSGASFPCPTLISNIESAGE
jgi:hypothetical protein